MGAHGPGGRTQVGLRGQLTDEGTLRWYGRRHGRKLRGGRRVLIQDMLPRVRLVVPRHGGGLDLSVLFAKPMAETWLEIGFGGGEHLAAQARAHPEIGMIGCEPYVNGVASLLAIMERDGLANIRIFDDDARLLLDSLADFSIGRAYLLFSDPWPKKKHHKRRVISGDILDTLARLLKDGAELRFASDHMGYVRWTLELATRHPSFRWLAGARRDWLQRPADGYQTRYEAKAAAAGAVCVHLAFERLKRAAET
jgi:tRNA (guanine-N7-)-methyltransferase